MSHKISVFLTLFYFTKCKSPFTKQKRSSWRIECDVGLLTDAECPINGVWSPWGPWSLCKGSCVEMGQQKRSRLCNNPPPINDGLPCSGHHEEAKMCHLHNCSVRDFRIEAETDPVRLTVYRDMENSPIFEKCIENACTFTDIEKELNHLSGTLDTDTFWNNLQCIKYNQGCPVHGGWSEWSSWSDCSAFCGSGTRWRNRRCDSPPPTSANSICKGKALQIQPCKNNHCRSVANSCVNNDWSEWDSWSRCTESCGSGMKKRRRRCIINNNSSESHCYGPREDVIPCKSKMCILDGGWSSWSPWSECSKTCDVGRKIRMRSCSRPKPSLNGTQCIGPKTDIGSCLLEPCNFFEHKVLMFDGYYDVQMKIQPSKLFHCFMRIRPLKPFGNLIQWGTTLSIQMNLRNWHVCVETTGFPGKGNLKICDHNPLVPYEWHSLLFAVTSEFVFLRIDDSVRNITTYFSYNLVVLEKDSILFGQMFSGELEEIIINYKPINLVAISTSNNNQNKSLKYKQSDFVEAVLKLDSQYIRLPCSQVCDVGILELTFRSTTESGLIIYIFDKRNIKTTVKLMNKRIKVKVEVNQEQLEATSTSEIEINQYINMKFKKKKKSLEVVFNSYEKIYLDLGDLKNITNSNPHAYGECFVGGIPNNVNKDLDFWVPFTGEIAVLRINSILQDLHKLSVERIDMDRISSRTASLSGFYEEEYSFNRPVELTCFYGSKRGSYFESQWLFLDTYISATFLNRNLSVYDNGKLSKITGLKDTLPLGFYTCRVISGSEVKNIITYGVTGQLSLSVYKSETLTLLQLAITVTLAVFTISWLLIEFMNDVFEGYGFFRDRELDPHEEADILCAYIDEHENLIGSKSAANAAKSRVQRNATLLANGCSYPQVASQSSESSPQPKTVFESKYVCYRMQCMNKLSSESSSEESPSDLYSRLVLSKRFIKSAKYQPLVWSKNFENPAQKVLRKFRELQ